MNTSQEALLTGLGTPQPLFKGFSKETVESVLGSVHWDSESSGFVTCPGKELHTTDEGQRDCKVYLDKVPTIHCMHASCADAVAAKNKDLRKALAGSSNTGKQKRRTPEEKQQVEEALRRESLKRQAAASRKAILERYRWTYIEISNSSPVALAGVEKEHGKLLLRLFNDQDVIWIGNKRDSGQEHNAANFLTKEKWLEMAWIHDQFICPSTYKAGSVSRGNDRILAPRFLVVESDELSKDEVGAIFRWLDKKVGLTLRAVVDTAGKSLHAWFDYPAPEVIADLKLVLPELGCDPKLFTPSQPVRMPGAVRDGKYQKLIYLNDEVKK